MREKEVARLRRRAARQADADSDVVCIIYESKSVVCIIYERKLPFFRWRCMTKQRLLAFPHRSVVAQGASVRHNWSNNKKHTQVG